MPKTITVEAST